MSVVPCCESCKYFVKLEVNFHIVVAAAREQYHHSPSTHFTGTMSPVLKSSNFSLFSGTPWLLR